MKKKIIGIVSASVIALALLTAGVLLLIKQKNIEETGNVLRVEWYDQDGIEFTITTKEQLYELARLSDFYDFSKQTIKLGADIVINEGNAKDWADKAPEERWIPISGFAGRFDGQGHTISGIYGRGLNTPMALFTKTVRTCVIQDVKLVNSYLKTSGGSGTASFISSGGGKLVKVYSDAIIDCKGENSGGIASNITEQSTFEECWYDGVLTATERECGGLISGIFGSRVTMKHCLFSGEVTNTYGFFESRTGGTRTGGLIGRVDSESTLIISDSLCSGVINEEVNSQTGAFIGLAHGGADIQINDVYISMNSYQKGYGTTGATSTTTGSPLWIASDSLKGIDAYRFTSLDFVKYWAASEEGPVIRHFAIEAPSIDGIEKAYDISWYEKMSMSNLIMDAKDLYGMYILSGTTDFTDSSVKLGADIVFNEGKAENWKKIAPGNRWYPINSFSGIFDGQGHTISGLYMDWNIEGAHCGLFGAASRTSQIKNFRLKNSYITCSVDNAQTAVGSISGTSQGRVESVYSDAIIHADNSGVGGIIGSANGDVDKVVSNCWFDGEIIGGEHGRLQGGIVGYTSAGTLTIEHCLNSGNIVTNHPEIGTNSGGFIGMINGGDGITITDSLNVGTVVNNGAKNNSGATIGYLQDERIATFKDVYNTLEGHEKVIGLPNGILKGAIFTQKTDNMKGTGGYTRTTLDFKNYWSIVKDSTPILKTFANSSPSVAGLKREIDVSWYDPDKDTYTLKTPEQFRAFATMAETVFFKDKMVKLGANITFNEGDAKEWGENPPAEVWTPIRRFDGTFDGQGHTISGIYVKREDVGHAGLFGMAFGDIKNLKLTNSYICHTETKSGDSVIGSIVGVSRGNITNVYSDAIVVSATKQASGGIVGIMNADTDKVVSNVWFDGSLTLGESSSYGGGIVGFTNGGTLKIEHCLNSGTITTNHAKYGPNTGGILGGTASGTNGVEISDCMNVGIVAASEGTMSNNIGSVVGLIYQKTKIIFTNTYASKESHKKSVGFNYNGIQKGIVIQVPSEKLMGYGGYQYTSLDFDKYWAVSLEPSNTPVLKSFGGVTPEATKRYVDTSWYDADATTYEIKTAEQLYTFAMICEIDNFANKTVKLNADDKLIQMPNKGEASEWATKAPEMEWKPIQNFAGTFEGNGNTISGIYIKTDSVRYVGLFGMVTGNIQNLSLTNSYICAAEVAEAEGEKQVADTYVGSIAGVAKGNIKNVYSDAIIDASNKEGTGGIAGLVNGAKDKVFRNCWYAGTLNAGEENQFDGGLVGYASEGTLTIESSLFSGTITTSNTVGTGAGGLLGRVGGSNKKVTIKDSMCAGILNEVDRNTEDGKAPATNNKGSVIGLINSGKDVEIIDTYATSKAYNKSIGFNNGGTVTNMVCRLLEADLTGDMACKTTTLDFADTWTYVKDGTPELQWKSGKAEEKMDSIEKLIDLSWCFESKNEDNNTTYTIETEKQLYGLSYLQESELFKGQVVQLDAQDNKFTMNEGTVSSTSNSSGLRNWRPIQNFAGMFEGQKNTINGIYMTDMTMNAGIFGKTVSGAVIQNFIVENSYLESDSTDGNTSSIGSVVGNAVSTKIEKVYVKDSVSMKSPGFVGGIVGLASGSTITGCWFDGTINSTSYGTGGVVGRVLNTTLTIEDCLFSGTLTSTTSQVGGMCGNLTAESNDIKILGCLNTGTMAGSENVDYMVGWTNATTNVTWKDNYAVAVSTIATNDGVCGLLIADLTGENAYKTTTLDFQNTWKYVEGKTPELRYFSGAPAVEKDYSQKDIDLSWCFAPNEAGEYVIKTEAQLYGLSYLQDKSLFAGKVVKLDADDNVFNMNEGTVSSSSNSTGLRKWRPIQNFAGTFNGNGETITGLYCSSVTANTGLFGKTTRTSKVSDLRLTNSYITSTKDATGSIVGCSQGAVSKVYSEAEIVGVNNCGGIVGLVDFEDENNTTHKSVISYCWYDGDVTASGIHVGGMIGSITRQGSKASIEHCLNIGNVKSTAGSNGRVGGLCGNVNVAGSTLNIEDSLHVGSVAGTVIGSGIGRIASGATVTINKVYVMAASGVSSVGDGVTTSGMICGLPQADLTGENAYKTTTLDFQNTWKYVEGKTPKLRYFSGAPAVEKDYSQKDIDLSWCFTPNEAGEYVITTEAQLYGLSYLQDKSLFAGKLVKLNAKDGVFDMNTGSATDWANGSIPNTVRQWRPIQNFAGTFNGNKNTVKGICYKGTGSNIGFFGTTGSCTITNMRLENSCFVTTAFPAGGIAGALTSGEATYSKLYSDAIVKASNNAGGILGAVNNTATKATMEECWNAGTVTVTEYSAGGIVGKVNLQDLTMNDCLNTGEIKSNYRTGGLCGDVNSTASSKATLKVSNGLNVGKLTGNGSVGHIYGNVASNSLIAVDDVKNVYAVDVSGERNTVGSNDAGNAAAINGKLVKQSSAKRFNGFAAYDNMQLQFNDSSKDGLNDGKWIARAYSTPELRCFAKTGLYEPSATDATTSTESGKTVYTVTSPAGLYHIAKLSSSGTNFANTVVRLGANITVNTLAEGEKVADWETNPPKYEWIPIGQTTPFQGEFDGAGKIISGIYCNSTVNHTGLFGQTSGSTIKDFALINSYFKSTANYVGSIATYSSGSFERIYSNARVDCSGPVGLFGGMLGGYQTTANVTNQMKECWFAGTLTTTSASAIAIGGLVGKLNANATLENCLNTGVIDSAGARVGGLCGDVNATRELTLKGCLNTKNVNGIAESTGTLVGWLENATSTTVSGTYAYAVEVDGRSLIGRNPNGNAGNVSATLTAKTETELYSTNKENIHLGENFWTFYTDKAPQLTNLIKYLSK